MQADVLHPASATTHKRQERAHSSMHVPTHDTARGPRRHGLPRTWCRPRSTSPTYARTPADGPLPGAGAPAPPATAAPDPFPLAAAPPGATAPACSRAVQSAPGCTRPPAASGASSAAASARTCARHRSGRPAYSAASKARRSNAAAARSRSGPGGSIAARRRSSWAPTGAAGAPGACAANRPAGTRAAPWRRSPPVPPRRAGAACAPAAACAALNLPQRTRTAVSLHCSQGHCAPARSACATRDTRHSIPVRVSPQRVAGCVRRKRAVRPGTRQPVRRWSA